jgi:FkbM family methyltransferase
VIYEVQNKVKLDLPEKHEGIITAYNTEWDDKNGQGWEIKNFIDLTENKKCLFDVGGNVGFFSHVFVNNNAEEIDKESFCFEPSPWGAGICFEILEHNKQHDRIKVFPYFVGDKNTEVGYLLEEKAHTLVVDYESPNPNFVRSNEREIKTQQLVTIDAFSEFVVSERELELDTIKIDVEGYEHKVLVGSIKTIMTYRPLIFLEVHSHLLNLYNSTAFDVYQHMNGLNYQMFDIHMNEVTTDEQYLDLFENILETRFVCNPREKKLV